MARLFHPLNWRSARRWISPACLLASAVIPFAAYAGDGTAPPALVVELDKMVTDDGVQGVTVLVFDKGRLLYRAAAGNMAPGAQLAVASASKWMAAALIMTVVDDGRLSLDEPIGRRLPEFAGDAGTITLRQILSFTSGQGGLEGLVDVRQDPAISLRDSARQIAAIPLEDKPGAVFKYGSPALQIAGALVEQATGESWSQMFDERLARPLGLTATVWSNPMRSDIAVADVHNPNLQGGLMTTAEDYGRFLTMMASDGVFAGRRILSAQAVGEMERVQTGDAKMVFGRSEPKAALRYGLGNWCETFDTNGACLLVSSPGAFGTYPWIDRRTGVYGIFFMRRRLPLVEPEIQAARKIIAASAPAAPD